MCDIWKRKDGREFHAADLERHRESIRTLGVKHVVLTGGEPLLNRELDAICEFFRDLGLRVTLLTTGLLLQKKADLVARGFDDIIISIDGPPEIHDRIRRVSGAFQTIQKGVMEVRARRPRIPISCRTTVQKLNHIHLRATVSAARFLGLNGISFLAADISSTAFNREERWPPERQSEIALSRPAASLRRSRFGIAWGYPDRRSGQSLRRDAPALMDKSVSFLRNVLRLMPSRRAARS